MMNTMTFNNTIVIILQFILWNTGAVQLIENTHTAKKYNTSITQYVSHIYICIYHNIYTLGA